jgi:hypothetical protein
MIMFEPASSYRVWTTGRNTGSEAGLTWLLLCWEIWRLQPSLINSINERIFSVDRRLRWANRVEARDLDLSENGCCACCRRQRSLFLANRVVVEELVDHLWDVDFRENRQHRSRQCFERRRRRKVAIFLDTHNRL